MFKMYDGSDRIFFNACELAQVQATRRQYRKWLRGIGSAFRFREEAARTR